MQSGRYCLIVDDSVDSTDISGFGMSGIKEMVETKDGGGFAISACDSNECHAFTGATRKQAS